MAFDIDRYLAARNVQHLPEEVRDAIARHGMRNGLVTSIAPTGTISLLAGNVSSGIEPVFDFRYERRVLERDGSSRTETVEDYAHALYRQTFGAKAPLTSAFVTAEELTPRAHLEMQAALQRHVDSSISKTINCPADISFESFKDIYLEAYDLGLKGCTTYRPNEITGAVLEVKKETSAAAQPELPLAPPAPPAPRPRDVYEAGGVVYMTRPLDRPEAGRVVGRRRRITEPLADLGVVHGVSSSVGSVAGSSSACASASRARDRCVFTVPSSMPIVAAVSATVRSSR